MARETDRIRQQLLDELVSEALEHLDDADTILDAAERDGPDALGAGGAGRDGLLRAMHTIKGAAGYMELTAIRGLAHALETVALRMTGDDGDDEAFRLELLLAGTTELRELVEHAGEPREPSPELLEALRGIGAASAPVIEARRAGLAEIFHDVAQQQCQVLRAALPRLQEADPSAGRAMIDRAVGSLRTAAEYAGQQPVLALLDGLTAPAAPADGGAAETVDAGEIRHLLDALTSLLNAGAGGRAAEVGRRESACGTADGADVAPADAPVALPEGLPDEAEVVDGRPAVGERASGSGGPTTGAPDGSSPGVDPGRTLRVPYERVDALIGRVGELLTVRNQFDHFLGQVEAATASPALSRQGRVLAAALGRAVDDLQSTAMELRLVRLDSVFRRLPRICRDAAASTGKDVRLDLRGGDTEVDKTVAEALAGPLLHLLRNAVDHGIERPADRATACKPATGQIIVSARAEAGEVVIEVRDDGAGIDPAKIRARAVERGLLDASTARELSADGVVDLLFHAGFSTAATVTDISGRGVGLDVVRSNVARLGGTVTVRRLDVGTAFELRLPVRLAATDVVLVDAGGQTFAVVLDDIRETLSVAPDRPRLVGGRPSIVQHGRVVQLVGLAEMLGLESGSAAGAGRVGDGAPEAAALDVMVAACSGQMVGLVVDAIGRHQQVVTKPLDAFLASPGLSGGAVLGDGRVVLVVTPSELLMPHRTSG